MAKKKNRKTRSDKVKRYKRCKRKKGTYLGVKVALPCGTKKITARHKAAIDAEYGTADMRSCKTLDSRKKGSCRIIFFSGGNPVMRASDSKLKKAVPKATRRRRAKAQCRVKKGPNKGHFKAC